MHLLHAAHPTPHRIIQLSTLACNPSAHFLQHEVAVHVVHAVRLGRGRHLSLVTREQLVHQGVLLRGRSMCIQARSKRAVAPGPQRRYIPLRSEVGSQFQKPRATDGRWEQQQPNPACPCATPDGIVPGAPPLGMARDPDRPAFPPILPTPPPRTHMNTPEHVLAGRCHRGCVRRSKPVGRGTSRCGSCAQPAAARPSEPATLPGTAPAAPADRGLRTRVYRVTWWGARNAAASRASVWRRIHVPLLCGQPEVGGGGGRMLG